MARRLSYADAVKLLGGDSAFVQTLEKVTGGLLLLMLTLYDAADNALQREGTGLDPAELYERILVRFAEREIRKSSLWLHGARLVAPSGRLRTQAMNPYVSTRRPVMPRTHSI
ncbi:hypothetical protein GCM10010156_21310 [Planobispora rosea]|uniref:NACHT N-terminal Helical domain-containing protein n=1 Tax=Planobispora rosea TaxID=35762 RepID=A0A8J3RWG0_PLARO|nr:hypothetical protein [Planobispora rosea]GGS62234.1 hypothetical protein GCM10010156_21310 [Planobispora rosea]GIH84356.1 hypothetical protein Pro02_27640 [Planobispora rosea]